MIGRVPEQFELPGASKAMCLKALPEATVEEAEMQGEWAFSYGFDYESNPYVGDPVWEAWAEGWQRGQYNNEG